ncbi:anaerobic sulfite reductase subunit A (plasmid) [Peptoclostridium acidaminophilum DSM 3953]|uniref:Anaerobic sulfite reductase subunit A n=1 Tax=Peptoclostridium acidaminophilum DSM 3953 TaxID=1286171 RepID=W8TNS4_PEPAC|nr:anaerobic sulfite reductase subunit AsrA [Peptoclostridium acidaminophilum]AHM57812.1 anaerobic sulfite reductase subunit A [Peptoclostridium acidaminophilum DSM 3953]
MGYSFTKEGIDKVLKELSRDYLLYAPTRTVGGGAFSDTDSIKYGEIATVEEIVFDEKSEYSFKEILLPLSETLFFFTEEHVKEADGPKKRAIIFLRSCDLHAVKRLDEIYLRNGFEDYYYKRMRDNVRFVLMGCKSSFENCFCVDMGTNRIDSYDASIDKKGGDYVMDNRCEEWEELLAGSSQTQEEVSPSYVTETKVRVSIPEGLSIDVAKAKMWDDYDGRCIACGRCNFVCPTCTCFTMQDVFYTDNGKVGERRRVMASCMVDGYTDVAGGGSYRKKNGQRMRFRVLHKVYDFKERFGYHMCTGCGRCDDACPEYISFSDCINKLEGALREGSGNE